MPVKTSPEPLPARAGVVIVGGGVIGCSIAREATRYTPDVVVLEKEADVACGTSKANNAEVHSGIGEDAGTLKQKLNVRGNRMYDDFVKGLGVELKRQGLLIVITQRTIPRDGGMPEEERMELLTRKIPEGIVAYGEHAGIEGLRVLSRDEVFRMEPNSPARRWRAYSTPPTASSARTSSPSPWRNTR